MKIVPDNSDYKSLGVNLSNKFELIKNIVKNQTNLKKSYMTTWIIDGCESGQVCQIYLNYF